MTKKQEKITLFFVLFLWGIIIICTGKHLWEIHAAKQAMISLLIEHADNCPRDIVETAFSKMKEKWNVPDNCIVYREDLLVNEQGKIEQITLELLDDNDMFYSINISPGLKNPESISAGIHKKGQANAEGTEQIRADGISFYKNLEFLTYLQTEYSFTHACHIQGPGKISATPESKIADFEIIFLHNDESDTYHCFLTSEYSDAGTWDNKQAILIPLH